METFTLNDGVVIPSVGFGVFMIPVGDETYNAVGTALSLGYRHIDTAAAYFNEADVGRAIRDSGIPREEIFVTSKLWLQDYGYEPAKKGIETSLKNLGLGYIDLYLIHQPYGDVPGAWKAMEEAKKEGKIRSIGVSNMTLKIWNSFVPQFDTMPSVNQVECNPLYQQKEIRKLMAEHDVRLEAWYPLGHGDNPSLKAPSSQPSLKNTERTRARSSSASKTRKDSSSSRNPPTRKESKKTSTSSTSSSPMKK